MFIFQEISNTFKKQNKTKNYIKNNLIKILKYIDRGEVNKTIKGIYLI